MPKKKNVRNQLEIRFLNADWTALSPEFFGKTNSSPLSPPTWFPFDNLKTPEGCACAVRPAHACVPGCVRAPGPDDRRRPRCSVPLANGFGCSQSSLPSCAPTAPPAATCVTQVNGFLTPFPLAAAGSVGKRPPRAPAQTGFQPKRSGPSPGAHGSQEHVLARRSRRPR